MAQLKDLLVNGDARINGTLYANFNRLNINGPLTVTGGAKISGRYAGGGDDEGLVIGRADNNYAGLCLGEPSGARSVMYLMPDNSAVWRYNNGSTTYDIKHPSKAGTIALTSDLSGYLSSSGGTVGGNLIVTGTSSLMTLHTYNPLYINNGTDNSKSTSLYTNDSNQFVISSTGDTVISKQTPGSSCLRNTKLVSSDTNPSANGEINWTYK